jgi:hypothetical protein
MHIADIEISPKGLAIVISFLKEAHYYNGSRDNQVDLGDTTEAITILIS